VRGKDGKSGTDIVRVSLTPMTDAEAESMSVAVWDLWEASTRRTLGGDPNQQLIGLNELFGRPFNAGSIRGFEPMLRVDGRDPITIGSYTGSFDLNGRYTAHMVDGARLVVPDFSEAIEKVGRKVLMRVRPEEAWSRVEYITGRQFCMDALHSRFVWEGITYPTFSDWLTAAGGKFKRASVKYYPDADGLLQQASQNTPVIVYGLDSHDCLGLSFEDASTNLALYCRDLTQSKSWTASNMAVTRTDGADGGANTA
jgi:hypothetical protein